MGQGHEVWGPHLVVLSCVGLWLVIFPGDNIFLRYLKCVRLPKKLVQYVSTHLSLAISGIGVPWTTNIYWTLILAMYFKALYIHHLTEFLQNLMNYVLLFCPFDRWENWGSESLGQVASWKRKVRSNPVLLSANLYFIGFFFFFFFVTAQTWLLSLEETCKGAKFATPKFFFGTWITLSWNDSGRCLELPPNYLQNV